MLDEIRVGKECFSDANLEISTCDQCWDKESLKELRERNIFFMSNGIDSVTPIRLFPNSRLFQIGVEDDGTLFFGRESLSVIWIDSLINELQTLKEYLNGKEIS